MDEWWVTGLKWGAVALAMGLAFRRRSVYDGLLRWAVGRGDVAWTRRALHWGAWPDGYHPTPRPDGDPNHPGWERVAHLAAARGCADVLRELLQAGAVVDAPDSADSTPLMLAAAAGHIAAVEVLLEHGANAAIADPEGHTAGHLAAARGHHAVAALLQARAGHARRRETDCD